MMWTFEPLIHPECRTEPTAVTWGGCTCGSAPWNHPAHGLDLIDPDCPEHGHLADDTYGLEGWPPGEPIDYDEPEHQWGDLPDDIEPEDHRE